MLAQQHDQRPDPYYDGQDVDTKVSRAAHVGVEILPRGLSRWLGMGAGVSGQTFTGSRPCLHVAKLAFSSVRFPVVRSLSPTASRHVHSQQQAILFRSRDKNDFSVHDDPATECALPVPPNLVGCRPSSREVS